MDIWPLCNQNMRQFSCFSKTHGSLSWIDLCVGTSHMVTYLQGGKFSQGIADHSHLALWPTSYIFTQISMEMKCLLASAIYFSEMGGHPNEQFFFILMINMLTPQKNRRLLRPFLEGFLQWKLVWLNRTLLPSWKRWKARCDSLNYITLPIHQTLQGRHGCRHRIHWTA